MDEEQEKAIKIQEEYKKGKPESLRKDEDSPFINITQNHSNITLFHVKS